jgi:cbb3-type cytochrome oxidase subunit 1
LVYPFLDSHLDHLVLDSAYRFLVDSHFLYKLERINGDIMGIKV